MNTNKFNETRKDILERAYHECLCEMYAKAQPEADFENLVEEAKSGKISKEERVYERHYLSDEEFRYIKSKYKEKYNIKSQWREHVETVEDYLTNGGYANQYIETEYGKTHKKVEPLQKQLEETLMHSKVLFDSEAEVGQLSEALVDVVLKNIKECKDFYRFDTEEQRFDFSISMGPSPTSNPKTVKKWWKENYDKDIEIEEHNPKLFWYRDNGYTDEDLEEEFGDPNWKEKFDKEWKDENRKK